MTDLSIDGIIVLKRRIRELEAALDRLHALTLSQTDDITRLTKRCEEARIVVEMKGLARKDWPRWKMLRKEWLEGKP